MLHIVIVHLVALIMVFLYEIYFLVYIVRKNGHEKQEPIDVYDLHEVFGKNNP